MILRLNSLKMTQIKYYLIAIVLIINILGCKKSQENPAGNIIVNISLQDQYGYNSSDKSGISIDLSSGTKSYSGITNTQGTCTFETMTSGLYRFKLNKTGYISNSSSPEISHKSDSIQTVASFEMTQIPTYNLTIDSIAFSTENDQRLFSYGNIINIDRPPSIQFGFIAYFGDNNQVSKDNYLFYHFGSILYYQITGTKYMSWVTAIVYPLLSSTNSTLYVRFYPKEKYFDWTTIRTESYGTPSGVFKWVIK